MERLEEEGLVKELEATANNVVRRVRSSYSESLVDTASETELDETVGRIANLGNGDIRDRKSASKLRKCLSLYGAPPNCQFGPKACLAKCVESSTIQDPGSQMLTWEKPPQSVLIIKKISDDDIDQPFVQLAVWLVQTKKMVVFVEKKVLEDPRVVKQEMFADIRSELCIFTEGEDNLCGMIDFIICLGGDGTLLYASTLFQESVPPVMAFHLGSLGFLSPFEFCEFKDRVTEVLQGSSVRLMLRTRLRCFVKHDKTSPCKEPSSTSPILALNEVVIDRGASPYLCQLDLFIHHQQVTVVQGDGLIISTPTGSTAYAAAAGASIVHPNVPAIIIAPICPHSLSFRPIVVPSGVEIKVVVSQEARGDAWASFDGRQRQLVPRGDAVYIHTSKYPLPSICHLDPVQDWFNSLAACLHWNVRKTQVPFSSSRAASEARDSGSESNGSGR